MYEDCPDHIQQLESGFTFSVNYFEYHNVPQYALYRNVYCCILYREVLANTQPCDTYHLSISEKLTLTSNTDSSDMLVRRYTKKA